MKSIHCAILALLLLAFVIMPAVALNGNSYDGKDDLTSGLYVSTISGAPTDGALYLALETRALTSIPTRSIAIAPYGPEPVQHVTLGVNGMADYRLPPGEYEVILPIGHGSDVNQPNTWKQESQKVTISAGQNSYVTFIGAGVPAGTGLEDSFVLKDATVDGDLIGVQIWFWYYAGALHFTIDNPNKVPVRVDITAVIAGNQPLPPFGPKVVTFTPTYTVNAGTSTRDLAISEFFSGIPALSVTSITSAA